MMNDLAGQPRKPNSVGRVNIISHAIAPLGKEPLIGLSGRVEANGDCFLNLSVPFVPGGDINAPATGGGLDQSVVSWLNDNPPVAQTFRDPIRKVLRPDAILAIVCCNSGGDAETMNFMGSRLADELGKTFDCAVGVYQAEIRYESTFTPSKILSRNVTRVKGRSSTGNGYFCHVSVPERFAGKHLKFDRVIPRPPNPHK